MTRHIIYLTNENLVSLTARGGRIAARKVFPISGAGQAAFEEHVRGLRHAPTHVITDLAEEDFRVDTIPHLGSGDRDAVLNRKISQIFRNTTYRHAIAQGRETEGRRDDRVVYTAITNGEVLRPWIEVLERLEVPLEGIHSSAVFSGRLLAELKFTFPHTLLVTFTPGDALRQTYFRGKEIKFSRLTPVDLEEGETLGEMVSSEVSRTWQYLDSLRYFGTADRLEVCVLLHAEGPGGDRAGTSRLRPGPLPAARRRAGGGQARAQAAAAFLQRRGDPVPPLPAAARGEPLRPQGASPLRHPAQRAHRHRRRCGRHPRGRARLRRLEPVAGVQGPGAGPADDPRHPGRAARIRRGDALHAGAGNGRADDARHGGFLRRQPPRTTRPSRRS